MEEERKIRYGLVRRLGMKGWRLPAIIEAVNYVMHGSADPVGKPPQEPYEHISKGSIPDGVHLRLGDSRTFVPFDPERNTAGQREACTGVLIKMGGKAVVMSLHDLTDPDDPGETDLTLTTTGSPEGYDTSAFRKNCTDASADWDGAGNTERMRAAGILNPKIVHQLKEGEYVPSMGEMLLIHLFRKRADEALRWLGADEIVDAWYWTSTENGTSYAWILYLNDGFMIGYNGSSYKYRVRPVSAFY